MNENIVIIIIQNSQDDFYVHQRSRSKKQYSLLYGLGAGGKVEPYESIDQAAKRELKEELEIISDDDNEKFRIHYLTSFEFKDRKSSHQVNVYHKIHDGEINPRTKEFEWCGWKSQDEVENLSISGLLCPDTNIAYKKFKQL